MSNIVNLKDNNDGRGGSRLFIPPIIRRNWALFLISLCSLVLEAQTDTYHFEHLTIDDGLSQNNVQCITQDHRGFLWVGTYDGLNRYDGYEFEEYKFRPADTTSLIDNNVQVLFEDSQNRLWVGAGGLNLYDRCLDRFKRIVTPENFPGEVATINIIDIEEDNHGNLWLAILDLGVYHLRITAPQSRPPALAVMEYQLVGPYPFVAGENKEDFTVKIHDLLVQNNYLWMTHNSGVSRMKFPEDDVIPDPRQTVAQPVLFDVPADFVHYYHMDAGRDQSLWVGTSRGLLFLENPVFSDRSRFFPYPEGFFSQNWEGIPRKIISAPDGKLWIGTYRGVVIFDPRDRSFRQLLNDPENPESIGFNNIADIFVDDGEVIWLGTVGMGLDKFVSNAKPFHHYLDKRQAKQIFSIFGMLENSTGNLWIAANAGTLYQFERSTGKVNLAPLPTSGSWVINDMKKDNSGKFWIANNCWMVHLDPVTGQMEEYQLLDQSQLEVPSDSTYIIHVDYNNDVWLCNTRSLRRYDPAARTFWDYSLPDLNLENIEALHRDEKGVFWIASARGLLSFEIAGGQWQHYQSAPDQKDSLAHYHVKCLLPDPTMPDRYLWVGTAGGGLHRLDIQKNAFSKYTEEDGLSNNFIYGILSDNAGSLWISTNHGLSRFDPKEETFTIYEVRDGLQSNEFNSRAFHKSESGELFFGGINGITAFFPWQIRPNPHIPEVVLTDMELSYQSVEPGIPRSPLQYTVMETTQVRLSHHQNNIAFEYAALDFTEPQNNQYRFILEGFDEYWIEAGTERQASYTNLPPGNYTFRVQGANNDGIWNEEGTSIDITITHPPWNTWWAYLLYFLLAGTVLSIVIKQVSDRRQMREKLRIKDMEAQKLAELDQFKSRFFANVSHEFRTPITLIQGRIDELLNMLNRDDLRGRLLSIKRNSKQLLRLIEQLLDIARLESSKMALDRAPGDILQFLRVLTYSLQSAADSKGVALTFSSSLEQLQTSFDPDALQKIVQNLLSNAIKFTPPGGEVAFRLEKMIRAGTASAATEDWLRMEVVDTGSGIKEAEISRIFERFYQSTAEVISHERGFGLGLALVKELVTLHGGNIKVKSEQGQGTTFTVDLPLVTGNVPAGKVAGQKAEIDARLLELELSEFRLPKEKALQVSEGMAWHSAGQKSVLVVEDHAELRQYLTGILQPEYKVIQAIDGKEGFETATAEIPDLIISDVMMPKIDGYELSIRLKKDRRTSHIPVILLTAKSETGDKVKGLELGVDDFLVKPFNETELKTRVQNLIRQRQALKKKYSQSLLAGIEVSDGGSQEEIFLKEVRSIIEQNLEDENFGVEVLAKEIGMSASQLYRKLRSLTEMSTVQLIQRLRLERAATLLKQGYSVSEVAYKVGLRSPAYFSQLFKKHFGCSPKEYEGI